VPPLHCVETKKRGALSVRWRADGPRAWPRVDGERVGRCGASGRVRSVHGRRRVGRGGGVRARFVAGGSRRGIIVASVVGKRHRSGNSARARIAGDRAARARGGDAVERRHHRRRPRHGEPAPAARGGRRRSRSGSWGRDAARARGLPELVLPTPRQHAARGADVVVVSSLVATTEAAVTERLGRRDTRRHAAAIEGAAARGAEVAGRARRCSCGDTGVLDARGATTTWCARAGLPAMFRACASTPTRWWCGTGRSPPRGRDGAPGLMLVLVARHGGAELADRCARFLLLDGRRSQAATWRWGSSPRRTRRRPRGAVGAGAVASGVTVQESGGGRRHGAANVRAARGAGRRASPVQFPAALRSRARRRAAGDDRAAGGAGRAAGRLRGADHAAAPAQAGAGRGAQSAARAGGGAARERVDTVA
jgi:hypothetical protein